MLKFTAANIHNTMAGCSVFKRSNQDYPSLEGVCADAGYCKTMEEFIKKNSQEDD